MRMAIIGPPDTPRQAEADALGMTTQLFDGPYDPDAQGLLWMSLNRAAPEVVWCIWDALEQPDVELIRQFRVIRGATRVIVELSEATTPPDARISILVSLGIYDLVRANEPMAEVLARTPQYGDVARWHTSASPRGDGLRVPDVVVDPEIVAAQTVAVISGKGGVGKTSFVANCLAAAAAWGAVGIDADYIKPSLHLAFRAADAVGDHDLDQLMAAVTAPSDTLHPEWSARDRQTIREWVRQAWTVQDGVRVVTGPSRIRDVMSSVPPGLVSALAEAAQKTARLTLIDTPGSTLETSWVEAVEAADWIVLVTTPDYAAVLESLDVLRKLDYLHIPRSRVWLVINKRGRSGYSTAEITQTHLKDLPLLAVLPDQPGRWHQAWRLHRPMALKDSKTWMAIVRKMTGLEPDRPKSKRPFRFRRRKTH